MSRARRGANACLHKGNGLATQWMADYAKQSQLAVEDKAETALPRGGWPIMQNKANLRRWMVGTAHPLGWAGAMVIMGRC